MSIFEKLNLNKKIKPDNVTVNTQNEEKIVPEFVKLVESYQIDESKVDTPEKAKENFAKCAELFMELCPKSGNEHYSVEELLKLGVSIIEGSYYSQLQGNGIRARLSIPRVGEIYENGLNRHIPTLTTGDHLENTKVVFDYFVSKFLEKGLVIKFNL